MSTGKRVSIHKTGNYMYASTQDFTIDSATKKKKYFHRHLGTLDHNMRFEPNEEFFRLSQEDKMNLIFPSNWDLSPVYKIIEGIKKCNVVFRREAVESRTATRTKKKQLVESYVTK